MAQMSLDGWSELHGPNVKAANSRHAAPLFRSMAEAYCTSGSQQDQLIRGVTAGLDDLYRCIADGPMFFSAAQHAEFARVLQDLLVHLQMLRHLSQVERQMRWQVKPKTHRLAHFVMYAAAINPRFASCYPDEGHVGTMTSIWKKSIAGRHRAHSQRTVLSKRWMAILLRLELGLV